jgi:uncharacterized protein YbjT (DUF2867 family)
MTERTALIIGATGLVGEQCLKVLLNSNQYGNVIALVRRNTDINHPKLEKIVADFDRPETYQSKIKVDDVYCAMGTTIGKAGSQAAFRKADLEIPLQVAKAALQLGARRFILVSAMGANAKSGIFYNRVKGELEDALAKTGYSALIVFRPSILLGDRKEKRTGEQIGRFVAEKLSFLFSGPLSKYKGTPVDLLAEEMVKLGAGNESGVRIIENDEIFALANK